MAFWERFEELCEESGMKPQSKEMQAITGVSSPAISNWKRQEALPKGEVLCRLAQYFDVSTDYLLNLTEFRKPDVPTVSKISTDLVLTDYERALVDAFRAIPADGQLRIIQFCLNERDAALKKTQGAKIV